MSSNYPPNNNGKSTDLLDRVLVNLNTEQRERVLHSALRLDIHPDDPLWVIVLALGKIQILLEDSPEDLRLLFDTVEMELNEWSEAATSLLQTTIKDAQNQQVLAHATEQLLNILTALGKSLNELVSFLQMQGSQSASSSSSSMLGSLRHELTTQLAANSASLQDFIKQEITTQVHSSRAKTSTWNDKPVLLWISLAANAFLILGGCFLWQMMGDTNQRVQWVLIKQERLFKALKPSTR